jgi:hypothetical protein
MRIESVMSLMDVSDILNHIDRPFPGRLDIPPPGGLPTSLQAIARVARDIPVH